MGRRGPASPVPLPMGGMSKENAGFIWMEYISDGEEPEPIDAPSGRTYKFDQDDHCRLLVHHLDVNYLKVLGVAK